jgi:streptogramin lyase
LNKLCTKLAGVALLAALAASGSPARAASISTYWFLLDGTDSLAFVFDSIAGSTFSNRILRYRISDNAMSKMASDVSPNTNLVALNTSVWYTTRYAPYRIGRAELSTVTGSPAYYGPSDIAAPFDDMTLGTDNALWATSAQGARVVRVTQAGQTTSYSGNGTIHPLGIARGNDGGMWFADASNRRISRIDAGTGAMTDYTVPQLSSMTIPERVASVAGSNLVWFATRDGFGSVDPATGAVQVVPTEAQTPRRMAAGADGTLWLTDGTPYVTQFTPPASYAKLKVFDDAAARSAGIYVDPSGVVYVSDEWDALLARIATAQDTPADATVVEFYNEMLDHYFTTASPAEAAAIDAGSAGPGWARTGESWKGWTGGPIPNAAEVCRFYGSPDADPVTGKRRGPNSHFYTLQPAECASVRTDPGWTYESAGRFWMMKPGSDGAAGCPSWTVPVYRAYNNRFADNDSNHRYMTSPVLYAQMVAKGWTGEGVVMCAPAR